MADVLDEIEASGRRRARARAGRLPARGARHAASRARRLAHARSARSSSTTCTTRVRRSGARTRRTGLPGDRGGRRSGARHHRPTGRRSVCAPPAGRRCCAPTRRRPLVRDARLRSARSPPSPAVTDCDPSSTRTSGATSSSRTRSSGWWRTPTSTSASTLVTSPTPGIDPVAAISRYADRIGHIHLKDIRPDVLDRVDARGSTSGPRSRPASSARSARGWSTSRRCSPRSTPLRLRRLRHDRTGPGAG